MHTNKCTTCTYTMSCNAHILRIIMHCHIIYEIVYRIIIIIYGTSGYMYLSMTIPMTNCILSDTNSRYSGITVSEGLTYRTCTSTTTVAYSRGRSLTDRVQAGCV